MSEFQFPPSSQHSGSGGYTGTTVSIDQSQLLAPVRSAAYVMAIMAARAKLLIVLCGKVVCFSLDYNSIKL